MPEKNDASLGEQPTREPESAEIESRSLGDELTFGGLDQDEAHQLDDGMEVVDLAARYTTEQTLGKGGMGEVLLATDTRLNRKVAIKRILGSAARNKAAVNRFLNEAKSIATLNHPNIVQIYDYGRDHDGPFLIMEFVEGNSLLDRCREGAIPLEEATDLACQLCEGLSKAHEAGIIHRDIKPANVLLTVDGIPKLTDFGLAKVESADTGMTMAGAVLGTIDFMPPEQRRDAAQTDARSDLWSLAATFYQMVTGKSPKIIKLTDVPKSLQDVLGTALEDEKDDRYQTAREFRDALRAGLKSASSVAVEPPVELGAGECSKCHARNEASRKFCSGCGTSLRVSCLGCDKEIPVWDKFCPECGVNQHEIIAARLAELEQQRKRAEQLRSEYAYKAALQLAGEVAAVDDQRLLKFKPWADEFLESAQGEWDRHKETARQHYGESKKHRAAFDYDAAIRAIEQIPEPIRTRDMSASLEHLKGAKGESMLLMRTIKNRIKSRDLDGLLEQVNRAIELYGDRTDLMKLQQQLRERHTKLISQRDEAYVEAEKVLSEGDARKAHQLIESIAGRDLTDRQRTLKARLQNIVAAEQELTALVKEAKADGVIEPAEVVAMLPKAMEYLKLNPKHAVIRKLYDDLLARLPQCPEQALRKLPLGVLEKVLYLTNSIGMELRLIPRGTFTMGEGGDTHQVTLTQSFYLGIYEVTQKQYERVMGTNPSHFKGAQNPVENVSWNDAVEFCRKLSALPEERAAGRVYRLPTEAQWEYACRAGTTTEYSFGDAESQLAEYAWYDDNSGRTTHPVGEKKPNPWGLYDMHSNVWEWCEDWFGYDYYKTSPSLDPRGPETGKSRVLRGGSWNFDASFCRSASRYFNDPSSRSYYFGFRVVCELE